MSLTNNEKHRLIDNDDHRFIDRDNCRTTDNDNDRECQQSTVTVNDLSMAYLMDHPEQVGFSQNMISHSL